MNRQVSYAFHVTSKGAPNSEHLQHRAFRYCHFTENLSTFDSPAIFFFFLVLNKHNKARGWLQIRSNPLDTPAHGFPWKKVSHRVWWLSQFHIRSQCFNILPDIHRDQVKERKALTSALPHSCLFCFQVIKVFGKKI